MTLILTLTLNCLLKLTVTITLTWYSTWHWLCLWLSYDPHHTLMLIHCDPHHVPEFYTDTEPLCLSYPYWMLTQTSTLIVFVTMTLTFTLSWSRYWSWPWFWPWSIYSLSPWLWLSFWYYLSSLPKPYPDAYSHLVSDHNTHSDFWSWSYPYISIQFDPPPCPWFQPHHDHKLDTYLTLTLMLTLHLPWLDHNLLPDPDLTLTLQRPLHIPSLCLWKSLESETYAEPEPD